MGFRDEFRAAGRIPERLLLPEHGDDARPVSEEERLSALEEAVKSSLAEGLRVIGESDAETAPVLQGELVYQVERFGLSRYRRNGERSAAETSAAIQQMSDYLGAAMSEVRWSVERQAQASERLLETLLESLGNDSRQYFEQGVKCYEAGEYEMARERFNRALEADRTNHFAYQYLGFIAVAEDNESEAIRSFDLARKFAGDGYHQALALTHLARSHHAAHQEATAADYARAATEACPDNARFWYDRAAYNARLELRKQAIAALKEAIERDWTYWAVVINDQDFEPIREEVYHLLTELRERERARACQVIDDLRRAIATAERAGAGEQLGDCRAALDDFEERHKQNNVFIHREHLSEVPQWHDLAFRLAEQALEARLGEKQREIDRLIEMADRHRDSLRTQEGSLARQHKSASPRAVLWKMSWGLYLLWGLAWIGICALLKLHPPYIGPGSLALLVVAILVLPIILLFIRHLRRELSGAAELSLPEPQEPAPHRIEVDYSESLAALESELAELRILLERCRQKQYV
jgi:tetratricopeptide (TPR) repeat protein